MLVEASPLLHVVSRRRIASVSCTTTCSGLLANTATQRPACVASTTTLH